MTRLLALSLLLSLGVAEAQDPVLVRGGALKRRAYQTYAPVTLYVDSTGSDSNPCTSSGTAACLTTTGALMKLPRNIRHAVTINVAAGTYTNTLQVVGFNMTRSNDDTTTTAGITIAGTQIAPTLTTGTASGTLTGFTAPTGANLGVVTDSTQNWTTNELRGRYFKATSGAVNGQNFVIQSNTATTITLATDTSVASITSGITYSLLTPGAIFTGPGAVIRGNLSGSVTLQDLALTPSASATRAIATLSNNTGNLVLTRTRLVTSGVIDAISASAPQTTPLIFATDVDIETAGTGVCALSLTTAMQFAGGMIRNTGTSSLGLCMRENSSVGVTTFFAGHVEASGGDGCVLFQNNFGGSYFSQLTTYCLSAGGYGILAHPPRTQAFGAIALLGYGSLGVKNCDWGISISSPMTLEMGTTTIDTATTGLEVLNGGTINLRTGTPTFTSVTNELAVDGTNYTLSYFNTLSPARIMGPFNSRIINQ